MKVCKNIVFLSLAAIVVMMFSAPINAQFIENKRGTIREQIEKSPLFNDKVQIDDPLIAEMLDYAATFKGTKYRLGATGPKRFDCSGFTSYVFAHVGYKLDRTSRQQVTNGKEVEINELQPGDLVFTYGGDHVGIYVGGGSYIHAPQPGDSVKVSPVTSFYTARRVL